MPTEDFLYHLYRASALLEDGAPRDAMVEIESALVHEPNDVRARELQERARSRANGNGGNGGSNGDRPSYASFAAAVVRPRSAPSPANPPSISLVPAAAYLSAPSPSSPARSVAPPGVATGALAELALTGATGFNVRIDAIRAFTVELGALVERDDQTQALLGGATHPFVEAAGAGRLLLSPRSAHRIEAVAVSAAQPLFVREDALVGFERTLAHVSARVGEVPMVQLQGDGQALLEAPAALRRVRVDPDETMTVRADRALVGWVGRLLAHAPGADEAPVGLRGLLRFTAPAPSPNADAGGAHLLLALG
jgi:uncharacterized protein (AIM24 family)